MWNSYAQQLKATKGIDAVHEGGKTGRHCKTLVNAHGIETAEKMVSVFLKDTDPWIADKAWSLGALVSQQQKYLAKTNSVRPRPVLNFGEDEE